MRWFSTAFLADNVFTLTLARFQIAAAGLWLRTRETTALQRQ